MRPVTLFQVLGSESEPAPQIRLRRADTGLTIEVEAVALLAQYQTDSGDVLLVLDEDCIYEEQLHLVLVRGDRVADHVLIGAPYATGEYQEIGIDRDVLHFRFANDRELRLEVDEKGSRMSGGLSGGARRKGGWLQPKFLRLTQAGGGE